ncbi:glycosyltransferase family 9 protein [Promicromonospora sukumoe]|uniref:glycosyltransferase family 9 protein n=1 Tax=Promicromonospora sukumoe TaxID=88382 RepID=UPI00364F1C2F
MTVLVLRALGLGDALTGVAALRGVRRAWPGHRVVLAAPGTVGRWLAGLGVVDAVVPSAGLQRLPWPWSGPGGAADAPGCLAVDLHGRGPESHRILLATRPDALVAFDCPGVGHAGPRWDDAEHEVLRWCRLVRGVGGDCGPEDLRLDATDPAGRRPGHEADRAGVVVHPGAAAAARRWPAARWGRVVSVLAARGHHVTLTGSPAEERLCAQVRRAAALGGADGAVQDVSGRLDLPALARLVGQAQLLVSGDTGVAHLATAYGTPSVTLFGPTPPARWGPVIDQHRHAVLWFGDEDAPPGDPHAGRLDPVLARIGVEHVVAACEEMLSRPLVPANGTRTPSGTGRPATRPGAPSPGRTARG